MGAPRLSPRQWLEKDRAQKVQWLMGRKEICDALTARFTNTAMGHHIALVMEPSGLKKLLSQQEEVYWLVTQLECVLMYDDKLFEQVKNGWRTAKHRLEHNIHKGSRVYLSARALDAVRNIAKQGSSQDSKSTSSIVNDVLEKLGEQVGFENKALKDIKKEKGRLEYVIQNLEKQVLSYRREADVLFHTITKELLDSYNELELSRLKLKVALGCIEDLDKRVSIEKIELDESKTDQIKRAVNLITTGNIDLAKLVLRS